MVPTQRFYLGLLVGAGLAMAIALLGRTETSLGLALLGMLLYDLGLLGLMILDGQRGEAQRITIARHPLHRLSIGRDNPVQITLQSQASPAIVQIRDGFPSEHFTVSQDTLTAELAPHTTLDLTYTAHPTQRGEYRWGNLSVRQQTPWKLAWMDWTVAQADTVAVFPDLIGLRSLSIRLALQSTGAMRQARRTGIGTEFAELRDYATGDDPRLIDWKATARRQRPLVRVLEPEQEQTLIILLDRGRLMTAQVHDLTRFDWGLNATLALAMTALKRGDRVGVGVFDRTVQTWIPPQRGANHLNHLLERLTPIQPELIEPDYLGAVNLITRQQSRRALVVMITDIVDATASAELLHALGNLAPRYLPFCVALRDAEVDRCAQTFTTDLAETYARAVALDLLAQRRVAFATLRQKGGLVLDAPAHQISDQLIDRYLQLKLRSQL